MPIFNTWSLLIKSNADDVVKGVKDVSKSTKQAEKDLKDANEAAKNVGFSWVKVLETVAGGFGAYSAYSYFKQGTMAAQQYNSQLYVTSQLHNQHAGQLKQLAQLAAQVNPGEDRGAVVSELNQKSLTYETNFRRSYNPQQAFLQARAMVQRMKALTPGDDANARVIAQSLYSSPGLQLALLEDQATFDKQFKSLGVTKAGDLKDTQAKAAYDAAASAEEREGVMGQLFSQLDATFSPFIQAVNKLTGYLGGVGSTNTATSVTTAVGSIAGAYGISKIVGGLVAREGAKAVAKTAAQATVGEAAAGVAALGTVGTLGVGIAGGAALAGGAAALAGGMWAGNKLMEKFGKPIIDNMYADHTATQKTLDHMRARSGKQSSNTDLDWWMSKGYTRDQAIGILANMNAESHGNPNAIGDSGKAHGLFQWHEARRNRIKAATGIDINSASKQQQMEAAYWEMQHGDTGFNDSVYRQLKGANISAAYFSSNFEHPADKIGQALTRGNAALAMANSMNVGTANVTINNLTIQTQATDARGIATHIKGAIQTQLNNIQAKADNGRLG